MNPIARRWLLLVLLGLSFAWLWQSVRFEGDHDRHRSDSIERASASTTDSTRSPATGFQASDRTEVAGLESASNEAPVELSLADTHSANADAKKPSSTLVEVTGVLRLQEPPRNLQTRPSLVYLTPYDANADVNALRNLDLRRSSRPLPIADGALLYNWGPIQVEPGTYMLSSIAPAVERLVEVTELGPNEFELLAPALCNLALEGIDAVTGEHPAIGFVSIGVGDGDTGAPSLPFTKVANPAELVVPAGEVLIWVHMAGDFGDLRERHTLSPGPDRLVLSTEPLALAQISFRDASDQPVPLAITQLQGIQATALDGGAVGQLVRHQPLELMPGPAAKLPTVEANPEAATRPAVNVRQLPASGRTVNIVARKPRLHFAAGVQLAFDQPGTYLVTFPPLTEAQAADGAPLLEPLRVTVGGAASEYVVLVPE